MEKSERDFLKPLSRFVKELRAEYEKHLSNESSTTKKCSEHDHNHETSVFTERMDLVLFQSVLERVQTLLSENTYR